MKPNIGLVAEAPVESPRSTSLKNRHGRQQRDGVFYKQSQWTADGTTILATSSENSISTFTLPETLLQTRTQPLHLKAQQTVSLPETSNVLASAPYFALGYTQTHTALIACRDHPIQLIQTLPPAAYPDAETHEKNDTDSGSSLARQTCSSPPTTIANYNLIHPPTESYLHPTSLIWPSPGTHFLTGSTNLLSLFDITRPGEGPIRRIPTIPPIHDRLHGTGVLSMRGTVSALACQGTSAPFTGDAPSASGLGVVAAGTWTRWIGLYDLAASSKGGSCCVGVWSVALDAARATALSMSMHSDMVSSSPPSSSPSSSPPLLTPKTSKTLGQLRNQGGIMQTIWSPCGRYLLVNERQSDAVLVYDIRVTGKLLGWLAGRQGMTHQKLLSDVYHGGSGSGGEGEGKGGFEVWAGTTGGVANVWENVGSAEGQVLPSWDWDVGGGDGDGGGAVGSVGLHPGGSVVATCDGSWDVGERRGSDSTGTGKRREKTGMSSSSLKIWSIEASAADAETDNTKVVPDET